LIQIREQSKDKNVIESTAIDNTKSFLEIKDLRKSYPLGTGNSQFVVDVKNFTLEPGSQLAIHGPSGAGKSTFLNLIAGIIKPDTGSIRIGNLEMTTLSEPKRDLARAQDIGYVFQSFHLLQGCSALDNLLVAMAMNGKVDRKRARELLSLVGIKEKENSLPFELSIGQQQRVCLARALSNNPKLMLADEPTGNLDSANASRSIELLRSLCEQNNCTLLVVSHDEKIINRFEKSVDWNEISDVHNLND